MNSCTQIDVNPAESSGKRKPDEKDSMSDQAAGDTKEGTTSSAKKAKLTHRPKGDQPKKPLPSNTGTLEESGVTLADVHSILVEDVGHSRTFRDNIAEALRESNTNQRMFLDIMSEFMKRE
jgi:hypothetical protein